MPNPYNRVVKTPAEKRAEQLRKRQESEFAQVIDTPSNTTLDESDLIKMEYQEGPVGVGTQGLILPGTSAGTLRTLDGVNQRVPAQAFKESLTPEQQDQFFMPFPMSQPAPVEPETPWYADLPHVPGLSQAGAAARDYVGKPVIGFLDEYVAQPAGALLNVVEGPGLGSVLGIPGFSDEFNWNPEQIPGREDWREKYKENIPIGNRLLAEIGGDPLNVVPFGLAVKGIKGAAKLGKGAKATASMLEKAETVQRINDPQSLYYRHVATDLAEGQKQVIVVSQAYPQGRRITLKAGDDIDDVLDVDNLIGRELDAAYTRQAAPDRKYKILPGDASRAEVIKAAGALVPNTSPEFFSSRIAGMGARAMDEVNLGRANIPSRLIASDVTAFASREISAVERAEILTSYQRTMPKEVSYIDDAGNLIPVTRKIEVNPRHGLHTIPEKLKRVGPVVEQVNAPALLPNAFGNNQIYNIIDGNSPTKEVVAQVLLGNVRNREGVLVKGFWPTVEGGGPGMFSPEGIQSIIRQIGNHHPNLSNLEFGGSINARPMSSSQEFIGNAAEAAARRLSDSDVTRTVAESIDTAFPRLSSLDASRINFVEYEGVNLVKSLDINGMPKTTDGLINDAKAMMPLAMESLAGVLDNIGPKKPGQVFYSMADDTSVYDELIANPGILGAASNIPGARWVAGIWNRAQTLAPDDVIGRIGVSADIFKNIEKGRIQTQVYAWWDGAEKSLGFKHIIGVAESAMNKPGIWRAQSVVGYNPALIAKNASEANVVVNGINKSMAHGTIYDIVSDSYLVKTGKRTENGIIGKDGKIKKGTKQIYHLTEEQKKYIDEAEDVMMDSLIKNDSVGVKIEGLVNGYWHRLLIGGPADGSASMFAKIWAKVTGRVPSGPGAEKAYQQMRSFDEIAAAMGEGFIYDTNPVTTLIARLNAGVDTFADAKTLDKLMALKKADGTPEFMTKAQRANWDKYKTIDVAGGIPANIGEARRLLKESQVVKKTAEKAYRANTDAAQEDTLYQAWRSAIARNLESYRSYEARLNRKKPGYFEAHLGGRIGDKALIQEIFEKVNIPEIQNYRRISGEGAPSLGTIGSKASDVAQLFRALKTNLDLSGMAIQGQGLFFRDIRSWSTAVYESLGAIVREPYAYAAKNAHIMEEGRALAAIMKPTEFLFSSTSLGSAPLRIPLLGPAFRAFQRSFEWFIVVGQTELYKTTRTRVVGGPRAWTPLGGRKMDAVTPSFLKRTEAIDEFAPISSGKMDADEARQALIDYNRSIRNIMGTEDYAILGIRPTQSAIESTVFFASRFMRANISLIGSAMRGFYNPTNRQSRASMQAMRNLFAGSMAISQGIHFAQTGRNLNVTDPYASDWLQFPVGKTYYNTLGPLYPYFRTMARVSVAMENGDIEKAGKQIKDFLNSRAGIPFRTMVVFRDIWGEGESRTFEGEEIGLNPTGLARFLNEFAAPMGISAVADAIGDGRWEATVTEVFGLTGRSSPHSQMDIMFQRLIADPNNPMHIDRLDEDRPTIGSYSDASDSEKEWMKEQFPELHDRMVRGGRGDWGDANRQWDAQLTESMVGSPEQNGNGGMMGLADKLYQPVSEWADAKDIESGDARPVDGAAYRTELSKILTKRWIAHQTTANDFGLFQEQQEKPTDEYELALYEFYQIHRDYTDVNTGSIKWNQLEDALADFQEGLPSGVNAYISNQRGLNRDTKAKELFADKQYLRAYWDKKDEFAESLPEGYALIHAKWRAMSDTERDSYVKSPVEGKAMQIINMQTRAWMSEMHEAGDERAEEFEKKLVYWGYETNPLTPAGQKMQAQLFDMLGSREDMKIPANANPYPSMGSSPAPASPGEGSNTPQWLQQVVGAR